MKWIKSALTSSREGDDVYFLKGTLRDFPSGVWLTVNKNHFIIVDCTEEVHHVVARYPELNKKTYERRSI